MAERAVSGAMTEATSWRRRVGLVLSGGGARGAYEAGVLAHRFEEMTAAVTTRALLRSRNL